MTKSRRSFTFLAGFLKNPREVGSVVPSSRALVRRLADPVFGRGETHQGFWNIPPMRIYVWRKR